jgi:hypothetical protein
MDFKTLVIQASDILDVVESYQWELGRISDEVTKTYGYKALEEFSKEVESVGGVKRSAGTLRMYAYIYRSSLKLELPKDLLFSACQSIVFSDDPVKYAKLVKDGASGTDIKKAIYQDKYGKD